MKWTNIAEIILSARLLSVFFISETIQWNSIKFGILVHTTNLFKHKSNFLSNFTELSKPVHHTKASLACG